MCKLPGNWYSLSVRLKFQTASSFASCLLHVETKVDAGWNVGHAPGCDVTGRRLWRNMMVPVVSKTSCLRGKGLQIKGVKVTKLRIQLSEVIIYIMSG